MPVFLESYASQSHSPECLTIGLINNMPDEALKATERQYLSLLNSASGDTQIRLSLYTLPNIPRDEASRCHIAGIYSSMDDLWEGQLDGLIVTGKEPVTASLRDEACWPSFTRLVEWAQENTHSSIWSCLAAHAAVLHLDGIERVRSKEKLFGVFECERVSDHPLTAGLPSRIAIPHSRWNGVSEAALTNCRYQLLTRGSTPGVDTFIKQERSLFVFFQGHPEYEANTLLREYRRDIGRYCKGESRNCPCVPKNYFHQAAEVVLHDLTDGALSCRNENLLLKLRTILESNVTENTWRSDATIMYANWLRHIRAETHVASQRVRVFCG